MSKKKHPEHVNHERWLVSYADFITLLFAFFVVLFASGQTDKRKQVKLAEAMQTAFQHNGLFDPHSSTPAQPTESDTPPAVPAGTLAPAIPNLASEARKRTEAQLQARIKAILRNPVAQHRMSNEAVTLRSTPEGLVISLREAGFFPSGSAEIRPDALDTLRQLAHTLPHVAMRVEGHTDNLPIHTARYLTNWELSTARASTVTRMLLEADAVDPAQVAAAGYAEFHPVAENATEAGRAMNRRVDIVLLRSAP